MLPPQHKSLRNRCKALHDAAATVKPWIEPQTERELFEIVSEWLDSHLELLT